MPRLRRAQTPAARPARLARAGRALTASAASGNTRRQPGLKPLHQSWQPIVLGYYDDVPEAWYPTQFYARSMRRIRFFPARLNDQGEPEEVEDGKLVGLFERIKDASGGMSQLAGSYGQLMFLIGDGYLVVSEEDGDEVWEFLSPLELRVQPKSSRDERQQYRRLREPGATPEELVEAPDQDFEKVTERDVRVSRLWQPHPTFSKWADSPMRAVRDAYRVLINLTLASGAESGSRAAQRGGLFIPDEITVEAINPADDEDPEQDLMIQRIIDGYSRSIQNPGSVESMMPFIFRGPAALQTTNGTIATKEAMGWFPMGPSDKYAEVDAWVRVIDRIANGLDMPREMISDKGGIGAANHWSGWLLDETGFRQHVAPIVVKFCNDLASAYLRPAAKEADVKEWDRVTVWFDPAEAVNHPDEIGTAKDAHDRLVVSDAYYLDKIGATDKDAPDEEELARRTLILLHQVPPDMAAEEGETAPDDGGRGGDTVEEPPAPAEAPAAEQAQTASARALQTAKILGAAEIAVERAREVAGNRIARRSQSCPECMERIHGVPRALVAAALGAEQVRGVLDGHGAEDELVAGAGKVLSDRLVAWGINGGWPDKLGEMVEQHALKTLYEVEAPRLPPGFEAACAKAAQ